MWKQLDSLVIIIVPQLKGENITLFAVLYEILYFKYLNKGNAFKHLFDLSC